MVNFGVRVRKVGSTDTQITPLRPVGHGWKEIETQYYSWGYAEGWEYRKSNKAYLRVLSSVEEGEYHLSMTHQTPSSVMRCTETETQWILRQFNFTTAREGDPAPNGKARQFRRTVEDGVITEITVRNAEPKREERRFKTGDLFGTGLWIPCQGHVDVT